MVKSGYEDYSTVELSLDGLGWVIPSVVTIVQPLFSIFQPQQNNAVPIASFPAGHPSASLIISYNIIRIRMAKMIGYFIIRCRPHLVKAYTMLYP